MSLLIPSVPDVSPVADKPSTYIVQVADGADLLACLCARFPAISRERWLDRFARGRVLDDQRQPLDAGSACRPGQKVLYFREVPGERVIPFQESILYQDEHLLVADKPHFLPVTPGGEYVIHTLQSRLIARLNNPELQPLHRIDRHTAGLVLFSTRKETRALYQGLFRERAIHKRYQAIAAALPDLAMPHRRESRIVRGEPFFLSQEIEGPVNSVTIVNVLEKRGHLWRYDLEPVSGKKHQLRLHMAALGAPICNDPLYPHVNNELADDYSRPLQLLACSLAFNDPLSGELRRFDSQLTL